MVDIEFLGQLVDSMEEATLKLEVAINKGRTEEIQKLRTFIFDLHKQIDGGLE